MLRLITGKAGSGKTSALINEIAEAVSSKQGGYMLIVPEQYSHEAERELCRVCGDSLSLYAEVFSFTGLARRISAKFGGAALPCLDKGGRLLCMMLALKNISGRLKLYSAAEHRPELQELLLGAIDEMKCACISSEQLLEAAENCPGSLGDKLSDLALVYEAYEAVLKMGHADPTDRLTKLSELIGISDLDENSHVYVDGFIDFTRQEHEILLAMLKKGVNLCLCLTLDSLDTDSEIFELSAVSARRLLADARELGIKTEVINMNGESTKQGSLRFFADNMFSYSGGGYKGEACSIELVRADSVASECEFAAAKVLELVREKGCRFRDVAVAVRGFEDYRALLESSFRQYDVPLFVTRRSELMAKPLPALISLAYEIIEGGWDVDDVISYMGTGLSPLDRRECDILADYVFKWQLRSSAWNRKDNWHQHPEGYGGEYDESAEEKLREINSLRRIFAAPLLQLQEESGKASTARQQAQALSNFMERLQLPKKLARRADELAAAGFEEKAQEYLQLWEIVCSAIEQSAAILSDSTMDRSAYSTLFSAMLSKYDIGSIPVSLDRVSAGDFDRMRRRSIKHLIVLGCADNRLPMTDEQPGMFSGQERQRLLELEIDIGGSDAELWREFSLIYNCLSLPSESLTMSYSACGAEGEEQRPAFVFNRARALFDLSVEQCNVDKCRMAAPAPAFTLAANALRGGSAAALAAAEYFREREPERFETIKSASDMNRGKLSPKAVEALYGKKIKLSASKIDKFSQCRFAYFCQYGLRAKPHEPASFRPPEIGTFMHYVLEHTAKDVKALGGFGKLSDEKLREICQSHIDQYVLTELNDYQEKSGRFIYLFKRLCNDVHQVVQDMAAELRRSSFQPLDFELDFAGATDIAPLELGEGQEGLTLTGVADRVDGWLHDGKLYLRVVDYKTGRKKFSMSDVWYGTGLQMLLYLFALQEGAEKKYGYEIMPAGVMYVPARNAILSLSEDADDEEIAKKRSEAIRRSGLVLEDDSLINAWEFGDEKLYIPVKYKYGKPDANTLASLEKMGTLSKHIKKYLTEMSQQLHQGSIAADPFYRSQQENACLHCDYFNICHFSDGENGENCRFQPKLSAEKVWSQMEGGQN